MEWKEPMAAMVSTDSMPAVGQLVDPDNLVRME